MSRMDWEALEHLVGQSLRTRVRTSRDLAEAATATERTTYVWPLASSELCGQKAAPAPGLDLAWTYILAFILVCASKPLQHSN